MGRQWSSTSRTARKRVRVIRQYTLVRTDPVSRTNHTSYFMKENLERLFLPDYMPTNLDILHCRLKTTGITETLFQFGQLSYRYVFPDLN